jgi:hypothetical protein
MSLYVYAIAGAPVPLDDLHGVGGEPLRMVPSGDRTSHAIVGDIASPPALTAEILRAQDVLVRDLAERADALLPARFGSHFSDERALNQTLDELAPRLERSLTRVRGREQMTIRLFHDAHVNADAGDDAGGDAGDERDDRDERPGTRYMRRRAAEVRQMPAVVEVLRTGVAGIIEDERVERGQSPSSQSSVIGSIHHLIPRGSADVYRARLEEAAASPEFVASGIRLRVSGPSPAYAFAEADLS